MGPASTKSQVQKPALGPFKGDSTAIQRSKKIVVHSGVNNGCLLKLYRIVPETQF